MTNCYITGSIRHVYTFAQKPGASLMLCNILNCQITSFNLSTSCIREQTMLSSFLLASLSRSSSCKCSEMLA